MLQVHAGSPCLRGYAQAAEVVEAAEVGHTLVCSGCDGVLATYRLHLQSCCLHWQPPR